MEEPEPCWFGPEDRSLFGWVHKPSTTLVRGAVVMCGSMGQESTFTHYTMRSLAIRLAELGFVVVRFDWDGTCDAVGHIDDPDRVAAWTTSVHEAITLIRTYTSAPLILFGLRLGALLAVTAAEQREDVHTLVLWDSPRSGSSYIREQRVRQNTSVGGADPELPVFTALGLTFTNETLEELGRINLRSIVTLPADQVLVADRPAAHALTPHAVTRTGAPFERIEAPDQDDFLTFQILPRDTENAIVSWFDANHGPGSEEVHPLPEPLIRSVLDVPGGTERVVRIGEYGLFGIMTIPDEPCTSTSVVFVPDSFTPHFGLSRVWTETARMWVRMGIRSVRFDLSGCGDSPARPGYPGHQTRIVEHIDDVDDVVRFVSPDDPTDAILIGLCSGAYHCMESALDLAPRGVALINPILAFAPPERPASPRRGAIQLTRPIFARPFGAVAGRIALMISPRNHQINPTYDWSRMLESCWWQRAANHQLSWVPAWVWTIVNWILIDQRPEQLMRRVRSAGTSILFIAGGGDWKIATLGSLPALRRMERQGGLDLVNIPDLDHAMMRSGVKERVVTQLTAFVEETIAPPTAVGTTRPRKRVRPRSALVPRAAAAVARQRRA